MEFDPYFDFISKTTEIPYSFETTPTSALPNVTTLVTTTSARPMVTEMAAMSLKTSEMVDSRYKIAC